MKSDGYFLQNRVRFIVGGKEYFSLLAELITKATATIHLQFYIFDEDETGLHIKVRLKEAAERGVNIFLHVDGYASQGLSSDFVADIKSQGINFKWFEPLFKSSKFYFGRRMHHKVVVVDGLYALVGGINISNKYNDMTGKPGWLDAAVYCEGEAAWALHRICYKMWGDKSIPDKADKRVVDNFCGQLPKKEYHSVRIRQNDWVKRKREIWRSYLYMLRHAEDTVTIMCSYFLPGRSIRKAMSSASKRGVHIKVILAGRSDVMIAKHAERYLYRWMLNRNIEIYEYEKNVLHGKVAVYDNKWATVGSYNLNNISAYASLELNLDIRNKEFARAVEDKLHSILMKDCQKITSENLNATNLFIKRIWQKSCYLFINGMTNLFTFYFRQEE